MLKQLKRLLDIPVKEDIQSNTMGKVKEEPPTNYRASSNSSIYSIVEFVAIPSIFDIKTHLKMRERIGLFGDDRIDMKQLEVINMAVANSPVFATLNNPNLSVTTCLFFLSIMDELNLIVRKIKNPLRRNKADYERMVKQLPHFMYYIDGKEYEELNFIIINVMQFISMEIAEEAWNIAENIEAFQMEINNSNI